MPNMMKTASSQSRSRSRSRSKSAPRSARKVQFSEYEDRSQIEQTIEKNGKARAPVRRELHARTNSLSGVAPTNYQCTRSIRKYELLMTDMQNTYDMSKPIEATKVQNVLEVEGKKEELGILKQPLANDQVAQMSFQMSQSQREHHYRQNSKTLNFKNINPNPKQVRFQEENPNSLIVSRIKRSRSRSQNEREQMNTENHRTDFNSFLKKFKNEYIEKRK